MNDDDSLSPLLKTWRHQPPDARGFNRGVWSRLQANSAPKESGVFGRLLHFPIAGASWAMPVAASFALLLSLAAGSGAALAYESLTHDDRMAAEYARSIDPLQMSAPHSHP
jgi:hypothetical protein